MTRIQTTIAVALFATLTTAHCREDNPSAVLFTVDRSAVAGDVDEIVVEGYLLDHPGDATRLSHFTPGGTIAETHPTVLIVLPDAWAGSHLGFKILALRHGEVQGGAELVVRTELGKVVEKQVTLVAGDPDCGNGVLEAYELCDGTHFKGENCDTAAGRPDGDLRCTESCRLDVSGCYNCGNGAIEGNEDCDGNDLGGNTCTTVPGGFVSGQLACNTLDCTFDRSGCDLGCGNGRVDPGEECDGDTLQGETCFSVGGFTAGDLRCDAQCRYDTRECSICGNGVLEGNEECDGAAFGNLGCSDFGLGQGALTCVNCVIDTTGCCGDGVLGPGEECDGVDFGSQTCVTERGLPDGALLCGADCQLNMSGCHDCGNGAIEGPEQCDGNDVGTDTCQTQGHPQGGSLACTSTCAFDTSACDVCGNGALDSGEGCDDGNAEINDGCGLDCQVEASWSCANTAMPSVCTPDTCGVGGIDQHEVCDGVNLGGEDCWSQGYVQGAGVGLACSATCRSYDYSGCSGGVIDSVTQLEAAIAEVHASGAQEVIAIHGGTYNPSAKIDLDECGGPCGAAPNGVVLRPLPGETVCFTPSGVFPTFDVFSGNNRFENLCFLEVAQAYNFNAGTHAGDNVVIRNRIENRVTLPDFLFDVGSTGNQILANWIVAETATLGSRAIYLTAEGNTVAMNAITGRFEYAIQMSSGAATLPTRIDHNSIRITGGLGGGGVFFLNASEVCYRNNIVYGDGTSSVGLDLSSATFASQINCGGERGIANVNLNHNVNCQGSDCASFCNPSAGSIDMCDLTDNPGWSSSNDELCITPGTNPLIDVAATPLFSSYEHHDGTPAVDYIGAGADVGAREAGSTRNYGGVASACP